MANKLNAVDVVNLDYLRSIAQPHESTVWTTDFERALEIFAFNFLSVPDIDSQDAVLRILLENATFGQSAESNEDTIQTFAYFIRTHPYLLRAFAKQEGILLKRE
jgi:hypothetical protein